MKTFKENIGRPSAISSSDLLMKNALNYSLNADWRRIGWKTEEEFLLSSLNSLFAVAPYKKGDTSAIVLQSQETRKSNWPEIKEKARQLWERLKRLDQGTPDALRNNILFYTLKTQIEAFDMGDDDWIREMMRY